MTAPAPDPDGTRVDVEAIKARLDLDVWLTEAGLADRVVDPVGEVPIQARRVEALIARVRELEAIEERLEEQIHDPREGFVERLVNTEAERDHANALFAQASDDAGGYLARAESAEARVASVEAVVDEWQAEGRALWCRMAAYDLRAALAHATPSDAAEGEGDFLRGLLAGQRETWDARHGDSDRDAARLTEEEREALAEACWLIDGGDPSWGWENLTEENREHHRGQVSILAPTIERILASRLTPQPRPDATESPERDDRGEKASGCQSDGSGALAGAEGVGDE